MTTRLASADDITDIYRIWRNRLNPPSPHCEHEHRFFEKRIISRDPNFPVWVYTSNRIVVAWASLGAIRNSPSLRKTMAEISIYVEENFRGLGIGIRLAKHVKEYAVENTCLEWIHAFIGQSNLEALRVWKKLGAAQFAEFPPVERVPDRDCILQLSVPISGIAKPYAKE